MSQQREISSMPSLALALTCLYLCTVYVEAFAGPFTEVSFKELKCGGTYDKSILAKLDNACTFCHNNFEYIDKERLTPTMKTLYSENCFSSEYFLACLEASLLLDEQEEYQRKVASLNGKGFDLAKTTGNDGKSPVKAVMSMMVKRSRSGWAISY